MCKSDASLLGLVISFFLPFVSSSHGELVQARLEGTINSSPIAALNGQPWTLSVIFDAAAPEDPFFAGNPNEAEYFNTGPVKVLRSIDFVVGSSGNFTIHLVDPVPTNFFNVRIDIDNFGSKSFFTHVDEAALLPTWNGMQLNNFMLALEDRTPGGYADGTDHLPAANPAITIADFDGFNQVRINIGGAGQLIGTPSSVAFTAVPELSPGAFCILGSSLILCWQRRRGSDVRPPFDYVTTLVDSMTALADWTICSHHPSAKSSQSQPPFHSKGLPSRIPG